MPKYLLFFTALALTSLGLMSQTAQPKRPALEPLPYAEAGLTEREAAAHLLNRLTFGPRPGDIDRVVDMGLETWVDHQLQADFPETALDSRLASLQALDLSPTEIARMYPSFAQVALQISKETGKSREELQQLSQRDRRRYLKDYMDAHGLRSQRALIGELIGQKILRGVYAENQMQEVLTDFWFNHFNVALQDNQARVYIFPYERDAIRPNVLGSFRDLLGATAKHPAMLLYLDNAQSTSPDSVRTTLDARLEPMQQQRGMRGRIARKKIQQARDRMQREQETAMAEIPEEFRPRRGVNENYARELLELHTLGVDGGYSQQDVQEVARAFTGWTVFPPNERGDRLKKRMDRKGEQAGFYLDEDQAFLFRADAHDATAKTILGTAFPAGGGREEGERVLDMVAVHPSTVQHLAQKLATRFVSDNPPQELVDMLSQTFLDTDGDLRAIMQALIYSPHFWSAETRQAKVKSPYELAISSLRALDADVRPTGELVDWIEKMGQPLYRYQAPTGFPDAADAWINAGSLLNRMNFGLHLATGKINGVRFDLLGLNDHREPETIEEALTTYVPLLLPEQATENIIPLLLPMATDPGLETRLNEQAEKTEKTPSMTDETLAADLPNAEPSDIQPPTSLARTVGVILGSPDFQKR